LIIFKIELNLLRNFLENFSRKNVNKVEDDMSWPYLIVRLVLFIITVDAYT